MASEAVRVGLVSDFVLSVLLRHSAALVQRLNDPAALDADTLVRDLSLDGLSEAEAMAKLRRFRQIEMARLAWRDMTPAATLPQSLADLSTLADALIRGALTFAVEQLAARHGVATDETGAPAPLLVLAMGKLGGRELNYSSDVDLVFLYPDEARIDGRGADETEDYL